jgi:hypothetical protein
VRTCRLALVAEASVRNGPPRLLPSLFSMYQPSRLMHQPTTCTCLPQARRHQGYRAQAGQAPPPLQPSGHDLTDRFPLIVEALARLRSRSCIIDGEAVACGDDGIAVVRADPSMAQWRQRLPLRLRPYRAERGLSETGAARSAQGSARKAACARRARGSSMSTSSTMGRSCSSMRVGWGSKGSCRSARPRGISQAAHETG